MPLTEEETILACQDKPAMLQDNETLTSVKPHTQETKDPITLQTKEPDRSVKPERKETNNPVIPQTNTDTDKPVEPQTKIYKKNISETEETEHHQYPSTSFLDQSMR